VCSLACFAVGVGVGRIVNVRGVRVCDGCVCAVVSLVRLLSGA
jgi:hypothetical protein